MSAFWEALGALNDGMWVVAAADGQAESNPVAQACAQRPSTRERIFGRGVYMPHMSRHSPSCPPPSELTEADATDIAKLYCRCADYFLLQDGVASTLADAYGLFTDVPPEKDAHDQTVLGWKGTDGLYAIAAILRDYPHDGTWYLGFMIVDATQRNRGVGRSIYSMAEDWAAARGATEIRLTVIEANEAGERFWRSLGFCEVRRLGPDTFKNRSHHRIELNRHLDGGFVEGGDR